MHAGGSKTVASQHETQGERLISKAIFAIVSYQVQVLALYLYT
jgi:hypothetical protein